MKKTSLIFIGFLLAFSIFLFAQPRFTDLGNGTIKDNRTGLVWQKCSAGQSGNKCLGATNNYASREDAQAFCNSLKLSGFKWRLPERTELSTLIDFTQKEPAINTHIFPATESKPYWTNTIFKPFGDWGIYVIKFDYGRVEPFNDGEKVRCVAKP